MLGGHFSFHEGKQKSPFEKFVLKLYLFLMGGMRPMVFQQGEWSGLMEERREKQEKPKLQKINICGLPIPL